MARSSWKYHFFKLNELEQYVDYLTDMEVFNRTTPKRKTTLHRFNYFIPQTLHTGKWLVDKYFTKYHVGFKLGQFTKNRKPYYFRSKKKKNVTKKNLLPWWFKFASNKNKKWGKTEIGMRPSTTSRLFSILRHVTIIKNVKTY